jgi:hypothetical protein
MIAVYLNVFVLDLTEWIEHYGSTNPPFVGLLFKNPVGTSMPSPLYDRSIFPSGVLIPIPVTLSGLNRSALFLILRSPPGASSGAAIVVNPITLCASPP